MSQAEYEAITPSRRQLQDLAPSVNTAPLETMATLLRTMGTDLADERDVIRVLIGAKFSSDQVNHLMDQAIALAR